MQTFFMILLIIVFVIEIVSMLGLLFISLYYFVYALIGDKLDYIVNEIEEYERDDL